MKTSSVTSQTHTTLKIPLVWLRREQTTYFLGFFFFFFSPCCFLLAANPCAVSPRSAFDLTANKQTNKQIKCQQSLVLIKHPVPY